MGASLSFDFPFLTLFLQGLERIRGEQKGESQGVKFLEQKLFMWNYYN